MDKAVLDPTGVLREALFEGCLAGRLGLASREAQLLTIALGANGYVVVPRHLLDELLAAGREAINALDYFTGSGSAKVLSRRRLVAARAAVVEAVGPTREDTKP